MSSSRGANHPPPSSIAWTLSRRLGMVIVLALAFFLSAIVTIYTLFRSGDTQVPNLIGKTEIEAQKIAEQAGLRVKIQHRNDPTVPGNSVIETRPGPNSSVKKDSVLTLVVSVGPAQSNNRMGVPGYLVPAPGGRWFRVRRALIEPARGFVARHGMQLND